MLKKPSKLGLGRRVELPTIRRVEDPGFREYTIPDCERCARLPHDLADGQERLGSPLAVYL